MRAGQGEEYTILLRDDIAVLRGYEQLSNQFISKIAPLIGTNSINDLLKNRINEYSLLAGSYISIDEFLDTRAIEEVIDKVDISDLSIAFYDLIAGLVELYSAFVPWEQAIDELRDGIGEVIKNNTPLFNWVIPLVLFRTVLEPVLRQCHSSDLQEISILLNRSNFGVFLYKNGKLSVKEILRQFPEKNRIDFLIDKFIQILDRIHPILRQSMGEDTVNALITNYFRKMPTNIKERIYGEGLVEQLPVGILEEEKITLMSREVLIDELIERRIKLEKAYQELAEAELGKIKTTFLDVIAHELRTPLTSIKTYVELLKNERLGDLTTLQKEKLDIMSKNVDRLTDLINDMLEIPTVDIRELEFRKETFELDKMVEQLIAECHELAKEKSIFLHHDIPAHLNLQGDRNLLEKAFKNIVTNAIRYTERGRITISAHQEGDQIHVLVIDTGQGIPEDELERIFDPFYTIDNQQGGMGLGLSIVKNIIEAHGGVVWATSTQGKGSIFHVKIP
jgi:signal transduction histidine kinase